MLDIIVLVHPIDTASHPSTPPGWRWGVYVGAGRYHELERCLNAGWQLSATSAAVDGECVGAAVTKALRLCGIQARMATIHLEHDPIPAGADRVAVL